MPKKNNILLEINERNNFGDYPLLKSFSYYNTGIMKLLINYANENNIVLTVNEKNNFGDYPLLSAIHYNIEDFELLINYAESKDIKLEINDKNEEGYCPLSVAIAENSIEKVKILVDYAIDNDINLKINYQSNLDISTEDNNINADMEILFCNYYKKIKVDLKKIDRKKNRKSYFKKIINFKKG